MLTYLYIFIIISICYIIPLSLFLLRSWLKSRAVYNNNRRKGLIRIKSQCSLPSLNSNLSLNWDELKFEITSKAETRVTNYQGHFYKFNRPCSLQATTCLLNTSSVRFNIRFIELPTDGQLYIGLAPVGLRCNLIPGLLSNTVSLDPVSGTIFMDGEAVNSSSPPCRLKSGQLLQVTISYENNFSSLYHLKFTLLNRIVASFAYTSSSRLVPSLHAPTGSLITIITSHSHPTSY